MNFPSLRLGRLMSALALASFIIYTVCFTAILFVNKPFVWTDIEALAKYEAESVAAFKYIGMGCMIVYCAAFTVITLCIEESAAESRKIFAKASSFFALGFCITVCINYFVQITSTRLQLLSGAAEGLTQFTQSYSISGLNGINMLGWTFFYGIASLFIALAFTGTREQRALRLACILNFILMSIGLIGYIINNFNILLYTMNLGLGGAGIFMLLCFLKYFKKHLGLFKK